MITRGTLNFPEYHAPWLKAAVEEANKPFHASNSKRPAPSTASRNMSRVTIPSS